MQQCLPGDPQGTKKYQLPRAKHHKDYHAQDGKCAICRIEVPLKIKGKGKGPNAAQLDHCHVSGEFRGFLCSPCNKGLGHFKDSPELLLRAIEYLRAHRSKSAFWRHLQKMGVVQ